MTHATTLIDREAVANSFRTWETEQSALDAQLVESVAALEAYQSHLDAWQQELARERDELRQLRENLDRDQAFAGTSHEHSEQLNRELTESRQKVTSLTTALLARTEELRELDRQRADVNTELALARGREKELAATLASKQQLWETERKQLEHEVAQLRSQWEHAERVVESAAAPAAAAPAALPTPAAGAGNDLPPKGSHPNTEPPTASPILGSVMEQFGKLRQQRSMGRPNQPKPR